MRQRRSCEEKRIPKKPPGLTRSNSSWRMRLFEKMVCGQWLSSHTPTSIIRTLSCSIARLVGGLCVCVCVCVCVREREREREREMEQWRQGEESLLFESGRGGTITLSWPVIAANLAILFLFVFLTFMRGVVCYGVSRVWLKSCRTMAQALVPSSSGCHPRYLFPHDHRYFFG